MQTTVHDVPECSEERERTPMSVNIVGHPVNSNQRLSARTRCHAWQRQKRTQRNDDGGLGMWRYVYNGEYYCDNPGYRSIKYELNGNDLTVHWLKNHGGDPDNPSDMGCNKVTCVIKAGCRPNLRTHARIPIPT